jgi:hypothetical protein
LLPSCGRLSSKPDRPIGATPLSIEEVVGEGDARNTILIPAAISET